MPNPACLSSVHSFLATCGTLGDYLMITFQHEALGFIVAREERIGKLWVFMVSSRKEPFIERVSHGATPTFKSWRGRGPGNTGGQQQCLPQSPPREEADVQMQ